MPLREVKVTEVLQAGDTFLVRFRCPNCTEDQLQAYPPLQCTNCAHDFSELPIDLGSRRRVLSGTRRKRRPLRSRDLQSMLLEQNHACGYCDDSLHGVVYHVDHIIPLAVGGTNNTYNLIISCARCNLRAHSKAFRTVEAKRRYLRGGAR
jgi:hypothetical protein